MDVSIDISSVEIETERLLLRPWRMSDLDDFFEYASVDGVGEMAGWVHHSSKDISKGVLDGFIGGRNVFAVVFKENHKVIGSLGLHHSWTLRDPDDEYDGLRVKEVGYTLSKDYWGRGIMPEAVTALIDYCFSRKLVDALTCAHFTCNAQSKRVIEKCGFLPVKHGLFYCQPLDCRFDDMRYILMR